MASVRMHPHRMQRSCPHARRIRRTARAHRRDVNPHEKDRGPTPHDSASRPRSRGLRLDLFQSWRENFQARPRIAGSSAVLLTDGGAAPTCSPAVDRAAMHDVYILRPERVDRGDRHAGFIPDGAQHTAPTPRRTSTREAVAASRSIAARPTWPPATRARSSIGSADGADDSPVGTALVCRYFARSSPA